MPKVMIGPAPLARLQGDFLTVLGRAGFECVYPKVAVQMTEQELLDQLNGVHASLAETAASIAGALWFGDRGKVVGISNHTDFVRAVRGGTLHAEATPLARGRTTQLWQVAISDDQDRLVAHAKVRLQNVAEVPGS